ncbi:MAG: hypothetical protein ACXVWZ_08710 [Nocardioides sp.]
MRLYRILTGLVALMLAVALPMALAGNAEAAGKPKHQITVKGTEPKPNLFYVKGYVEPTYAKAPAVMERKTCGTCSWHAWKSFTTDANSHFKVHVYGPGRGQQKVCYRVKVAATKNFATSRSRSLCVVRL